MIRTILCPVDLSELSRPAVWLAGEVARRLGARVVLHHNVGAAPPSSLGVAWMWAEDHEHEAEGQVARAAEGLRELFSELPGLEVEAKITRGPLDSAVHEVARETDSDLLVIATHGSAAPAHDSETEQIVLRAPCSVLALGEGCKHAELEAQGWLGSDDVVPVVVPTDFTRLSRKAVKYALALADQAPVRLHLVHALGVEQPGAKAEEKALGRLESLVPESIAGQASFTAAAGRPAQVILEVARESGARFVLMAAHRKGPLRRVVFGTTTLAMLHSSQLPIWFVPEGVSAGPGVARLLEQAVE